MSSLKDAFDSLVKSIEKPVKSIIASVRKETPAPTKKQLPDPCPGCGMG